MLMESRIKVMYLVEMVFIVLLSAVLNQTLL
jgi:hypothetical protein